jgi:hypothetical protein
MGYDYSAEIVAAQTAREPWSGGSTSVTFGDIFSDKTKTTLLIVCLIAVVIISIIVVIIIVCLCCHYCPAKTMGSSHGVVEVLKNLQML